MGPLWLTVGLTRVHPSSCWTQMKPLLCPPGCLDCQRHVPLGHFAAHVLPLALRCGLCRLNKPLLLSCILSLQVEQGCKSNSIQVFRPTDVSAPLCN